MIISEIYRGKVYAGETPLASTIQITQTGPLQLTFGAGELSTTGVSRVISEYDIHPDKLDSMLNAGLASYLQDEMWIRVERERLNKRTRRYLRRNKIAIREGDDLLIREALLDEETITKYLDTLGGVEVARPSERVRLWKQKNVTHILSSDYVVDFVPGAVATQFCAGIGVNKKKSKILVRSIELPAPIEADEVPEGWTDFQMLAYPFVLLPDAIDLPDIIALTVIQGFPPNFLPRDLESPTQEGTMELGN